MKETKKQKKFLDDIYERFFDHNPNENERSIVPKPMEANEFIRIITNYILGEDWFIALSMNQKQANVLILMAIIEKVII